MFGVRDPDKINYCTDTLGDLKHMWPQWVKELFLSL